MTKACKFCGHAHADEVAPRSVAQLRRYHSLIRAAFMHWPESHKRQFSSSEELRAWVQMKAGAREVGASIPLTGMSKERAMLLAEAAIRGAGSYALPVIHGDTLVIFKPKSVSFAKMGPAEFGQLSDAVSDVIEAEIGVSVDQLLAENVA